MDAYEFCGKYAIERKTGIISFPKNVMIRFLKKYTNIDYYMVGNHGFQMVKCWMIDIYQISSTPGFKFGEFQKLEMPNVYYNSLFN